MALQDTPVILAHDIQQRIQCLRKQIHLLLRDRQVLEGLVAMPDDLPKQMRRLDQASKRTGSDVVGGRQE